MTDHVGLALQARDDSGVAYDGPHDIYLNADGNLALVYGAEAVGQHARQRVRTYQGEWFLNTDAGMPWLEQVLGGKPDTVLAEAILKAEILDTDGVETIEAISTRFDRTIRGIAVDTLEITTSYDE